MTLRWRLTVLYAAATAVLFAATATIALLEYRRGVASLADRTLMSAMEVAEEAVDPPGPFDLGRARSRLAALADSREGLSACLLDAQGNALYRSDPDLPAPLPPERPAQGQTALTTASSATRGDLRLATRFLPRAASGLWLQIGLRLPPSAEAFAESQARALLLTFLGLVAALGWTGWLIAGRALAPIARIVDVAESVRRGDLRGRIPPPDREDELGRLIRVLNDMLARIEASTTKLDQFAANVSHQLRTPLTIMRGEIEVALRGELSAQEAAEVLESALAELEKMSLLVEDLLAYARASGTGAAAPAVGRLDRLVEEVARKAAVLAAAKDVRIETEAAPVSAFVQPGRLEQALLNVIDNAVKNTPAGGRIAVRVREADGRPEVTIEDTGPGVPPDELGRLFERGRSRSSTGIGLGLAKSLVESFGGRIELASPGRGLAVRLVLSRGPGEGAGRGS